MFKALSLGVALSLAACSSSSFDVASGEPDSGSTSDTSVVVDAPAEDTAPPLDTGSTPADSDVLDAGPACLEATFVAVSEADAQLLQSQPTFNWGGAGVLGSRNDLGGPMFALMRFDLSGLPVTARLKSAVLDLAWAPHATDCATACGSCAGIDREGSHSVYYMRSDWAEGKVNWNTRDGSAAWGTAGALLAGVDRSAFPAASFTRAKAASASVIVGDDTLLRLRDWRTAGGKLSFLVQAEANALFLIASREGRAQCTANGPAPRLTIKYCTG